MDNALIGKSCGNPLKHIEVKILTDEYEIIKYVSKPLFRDIFRYKYAVLIEFYKKK